MTSGVLTGDAIELASSSQPAAAPATRTMTAVHVKRPLKVVMGSPNTGGVLRRSVPDLMFSAVSLRRRCGTPLGERQIEAPTDTTRAARVEERYGISAQFRMVRHDGLMA